MASLRKTFFEHLHSVTLPAFVGLDRLQSWPGSWFGRVDQVEFWKHPPQPPPPGSPAAPSKEIISGPHSVGTMLSSMVILPLPNEAVQLMLPKGLQLAPQTLTGQGQHPVCFMFCLQKDVRPLMLSSGLTYLEFILAVPYLQWQTETGAYRGPFIFMPRLYLDHWLPIVLGWFYGFAKERARMQMAQDSYDIRGYLLNKPIIAAQFRPQGDPGPPSAFPLFTPLQEIFRQPFVAKTAVGLFSCSIFDFKLDQAQMQSIEADVHISEEFVPGLPTGDFPVKGIDSTPLGAFYIHLPWTLSAPFECSCLNVNPLT